MFEVCTIKLATVRRNLAIVLLLKKTVTLKNPTPPTVFAAHSSNFAQTLTTKLKRSFRSRIFDFHPRSIPKIFKMDRACLLLFTIGI